MQVRRCCICLAGLMWALHSMCVNYIEYFNLTQDQLTASRVYEDAVLHVGVLDHDK